MGIWRDIDSFTVHWDLVSAHQNIKTLSQRAKSANTVKTCDNYFKAVCKWYKTYAFGAVPCSDYTVAP